MTDRELLELAAKAAGIALAYQPFTHNKGAGALTAQGRTWSPLTDDGDALRLAVKLGFGIEVHKALAVVHAGDGDQEKVSVHWNLKDVPDAFSATRRAIVLAAAEIGKQKESENA